MSDNSIAYSSDHWSQVSSAERALNAYLAQYSDVYNRANLERIVAAVDSTAGLKVMDYGGGIGIVAVSLAKRGQDVTLVDAAPMALNAAELLAARSGVAITVKCVNRLRSGDFAPNSFDVIVAKDVVEHVFDDQELVSAFWTLLKPGGVLILTTQNATSPNFVLECLARKIIHPKTKWLGWDRTHVRFYSPKSLSRLAARAGFRSWTFRPGYIIPYKLLGLLLPFMDIRKPTILSHIDRQICKLGVVRWFGWNIMIICSK